MAVSRAALEAVTDAERRVYAAELYTAVLVLFDVALTELMVVRGPAVEIGLGAVHWLAIGGCPALLAAEVLAVGTAFAAARWLERWSAGLAHQLRGLTVGFWLFTVISNFALAHRAGVIHL
jgi:hypothetical protein